ncbi:hypothetical protein [Pseudalkalibacillus hwajinpoensis]|uniref:hypothetical protein n=1 Tax=Guptibacillus hwajinpoensis TaxID=208199 RepID=UPI00384DA40A
MAGVFDKQIKELLHQKALEIAKQSELAMIKKAIAADDIEAVKSMLKYFDYVSAGDLDRLLEEANRRDIGEQELNAVVKDAHEVVNAKANRNDIKYPSLKNRLEYKEQLLNELEALKYNKKEIEMSKVNLSDDDPILMLIKKYLK